MIRVSGSHLIPKIAYFNMLVLFVFPDCRNLAAQFWARWCATPNKPEEFTMSQESILPDDMDLSIYAPDTTSASYGDQLGINMGEDVGMTMGNLSTLDINSCAPYMENNDYYNLNHFEPVAMNNNISHDNHQVYMDGASNYPNEPLHQQPQPLQQQHQQVLIPGPLEVNNQLLSTSTTAVWPTTNSVPIVVPSTIQEQPVTNDETAMAKPNETVSGLPVLKIKVSKAGTYVVNSTNNPVESKEETNVTQLVGDQIAETKEKEKSKEKEKEKLKERKREKDKKTSSSSYKTKEESSSSSKSSSDSKKRDKERERDRSKSSSSLSRDSKYSSSSSKDRNKNIKDDSRKEKPKIKASPRSESQIKEAKQAEKNRETLAAIKAMSPVVKLAKIPRKKVEEISAFSAEASGTSATEMLDKLAPRPKTVKTFNSKFRSTGLVEEPGKSPPIGNKKLGAASPSADKKSPSVKRTGSIDGLLPPADKKMKAVDDTAISAAVAAVMKKTASDIKPAVKLISARPRRKFIIYFFCKFSSFRSGGFHLAKCHIYIVSFSLIFFSHFLL